MNGIDVILSMGGFDFTYAELWDNVNKHVSIHKPHGTYEYICFDAGFNHDRFWRFLKVISNCSDDWHWMMYHVGLIKVIRSIKDSKREQYSIFPEKFSFLGASND